MQGTAALPLARERPASCPRAERPGFAAQEGAVLVDGLDAEHILHVGLEARHLEARHLACEHKWWVLTVLSIRCK